MRKTRDLTKAQFDAAIARHGFKPLGFLGYYSLPEPNQRVSVSKFNAGDRRRAQLAYLLAEAERYEKEKASAAQ